MAAPAQTIALAGGDGESTIFFHLAAEHSHGRLGLFSRRSARALRLVFRKMRGDVDVFKAPPASEDIPFYLRGVPSFDVTHTSCKVSGASIDKEMPGAERTLYFDAIRRKQIGRNLCRVIAPGVASEVQLAALKAIARISMNYRCRTSRVNTARHEQGDNTLGLYLSPRLLHYNFCPREGG